MDFEIIHYFSQDLFIASRGRRLLIKIKSKTHILKMPGSIGDILFSWLRLLRRILRLDKCNVVPTGNGFILIRQGKVCHFNVEDKKFEKVLTLQKGCRNLMHQAVAKVSDFEFFFGEYGRPNSIGKSIYKTSDGGKSWIEVYKFQPKEIRHIHSCQWDPVENKIWVFCGDFDGECKILCADREFKQIEFIGDAGQSYRTCHAFFEREKIHWVMDSPLAQVYHVELDRRSRKITKKQKFPAPVWYSKKMSNGMAVVATAIEPSECNRDNRARLYATLDFDVWSQVAEWQRDFLPLQGLFKYSVINFADGPQNSDYFFVSFEAIKGLDGKSLCLAMDHLS